MMAEVHTMKLLTASLFCKGSTDTECFRAVPRKVVARRWVKPFPSPEIPHAFKEHLQLNMEIVLLVIHLCALVDSQIVRDRNEHEQKHFEDWKSVELENVSLLQAPHNQIEQTS